jgi:hypothetical protein
MKKGKLLYGFFRDPEKYLPSLKDKRLELDKKHEEIKRRLEQHAKDLKRK